MIDLANLTIVKARKALDAKQFSAVDLAQAYLNQIEKKNPELNAYLEVFDDALEQAKAADDRIAKGKTAPLLGIPLAIKDVILIDGKKITAGSKILENYVATYDATAISKLKSEGAVFLGRTNTDEFAMGGSTENSAFGVTKNPHDTGRVAGGSSGGSAAALSANLCLGALGSDTGGSVREPASFCGVVGLKPTYGAISRYGLIAMGSSLDCIGVFGKTVEDAEIIFNAIYDKDPLDSTTISDTTFEKRKNKEKLTLGVPRELLHGEGIDPVVKKNFEESLEKYKNLGFEIKDVSLPSIELALAVYYIVMPAEASSNLARFDGVKYGLHVDGPNLLGDYVKTRGQGFGPEVQRRILIGTYVLSAGYYDAYYSRAQKLRTLIKRDFEQAFELCDVLLTPTTPGPAFGVGAKTADPVEMYLQDVFTVTVNLAGLPGISVPAGLTETGLPLGLQLIGKAFDEATMLRAALAIETAADFKHSPAKWWSL